MRELFSHLAANMWEIPQAIAEKQALAREAELDKQLERLNNSNQGTFGLPKIKILKQFNKFVKRFENMLLLVMSKL